MAKKTSKKVSKKTVSEPDRKKAIQKNMGGNARKQTERRLKDKYRHLEPAEEPKKGSKKEAEEK